MNVYTLMIVFSFVAYRVWVSRLKKELFTYSFKINGNPGKYKEPVKITYTEADGNSASITQNVEYTIIYFCRHFCCRLSQLRPLYFAALR